MCTYVCVCVFVRPLRDPVTHLSLCYYCLIIIILSRVLCVLLSSSFTLTHTQHEHLSTARRRWASAAATTVRSHPSSRPLHTQRSSFLVLNNKTSSVHFLILDGEFFPQPDVESNDLFIYLIITLLDHFVLSIGLTVVFSDCTRETRSARGKPVHTPGREHANSSTRLKPGIEPGLLPVRRPRCWTTKSSCQPETNESRSYCNRNDFICTTEPPLSSRGLRPSLRGPRVGIMGSNRQPSDL